MSERSRRYFWGNSLAQAVMSAARYHRLEPESLAYRIHAKRHGFVKHPRTIVIEVDPAAPRRSADAPPMATAAATPAPAPRGPAVRTAVPAASRDRERPAPPAGARPPAERPARAAQVPAAEAWDAPDADSEVAATEACRRLLRLAGVELEVAVRASGDRLEITLTGADEAEVTERGREFLEELEHLLPRAIHGLAGRMVRCRLDCGGIRAAHEESLRELAQREAARALATGEPVLLDPLSAAERRVVHVALLDRADVTTESLGTGPRKRVRISPVSAS